MVNVGAKDREQAEREILADLDSEVAMAVEAATARALARLRLLDESPETPRARLDGPTAAPAPTEAPDESARQARTRGFRTDA